MNQYFSIREDFESKRLFREKCIVIEKKGVTKESIVNYISIQDNKLGLFCFQYSCYHFQCVDIMAWSPGRVLALSKMQIFKYRDLEGSVICESQCFPGRDQRLQQQENSAASAELDHCEIGVPIPKSEPNCDRNGDISLAL